jgi:hypothetical protein
MPTVRRDLISLTAVRGFNMRRTLIIAVLLLGLVGSAQAGITSGENSGNQDLSFPPGNDVPMGNMSFTGMRAATDSGMPVIGGVNNTVTGTQINGLVVGAPTNGNMGAGSINADAIYIDGQPVSANIFTPPDGSTWTANGISNLYSLGVGTAAPGLWNVAIGGNLTANKITTNVLNLAQPLAIANGGLGSATTPIVGAIPIYQSSSLTYQPHQISHDAAMSSDGSFFVLSTNGIPFTALATAAIPLSIANGGNGSSTAPSIGQIDVATSATVFTPVTVSCTGGNFMQGINTSGAICAAAGFSPPDGSTWTASGLTMPSSSFFSPPDSSAWNSTGLNLIGALKFNGTAMGGTCGGGQYVSAVSSKGILTCGTPAGGGGGGYPNGAPPQLTGFASTNTAEAETVSGDATLTRASAGNYSITVTKTNGTALSGLATASIPLSIANGGTGATTLAAAFIPVQTGTITPNDCVKWASSTSVTDAGVGCGAGGGGVSSISAGTGITLSANPITTTGSVSLTVPVVVANGGTGTTSLTANAPLLGNGTSAIATGTRSGSTTVFATASGTLTSGDCAKFDASGNVADAGGPCGISGGPTYPSGAPPQIAGFSATNTSEAETLSGDATLTRAGLNSYTIAVTRTGGTAFSALATATVPLSIANGGMGNATAPTSGQIEIAQSATAYGPQTMTGDATISSLGAITVTKTGGAAFTGLATAAIPLSIANGGRGSTTAPSVGQIDIASSTTAFTPVSMSGDATITSAGVITVSKTGGAAFTGLATATIPLTIANGGTGATTLAGANIPIQSGAITTNDCVKWASATSITDAGAGCGGGSGTVTSITAGTGITLSPSPITATGSVALTVPVAIASGGRGATTAPTAGQIDVAQSATAFGAVTMSGDATITSAGAITVTKTSGTSFSGLATATIPLSIANGGSGSSTAPVIGQLEIASSTTAFTPVTMSGDATITSAGAITVTKTSGTSFSGLATATIPLSVVNGGRGSSSAPTAGMLDIAQSATVISPTAMSGDCTIASTGAITCTKTSSIAFGALATLNVGTGLTSSTGNLNLTVPVSIANGGTGTTTAPTTGQIITAQSASAYGPVTMSGDATITSAGAISVTKTSGTAFTGLATATIPLSIANGGRGSSTAPTVGQVSVATSTTAFSPVTVSCGSPQVVQAITSAGATCVTVLPSAGSPNLVLVSNASNNPIWSGLVTLPDTTATLTNGLWFASTANPYGAITTYGAANLNISAGAHLAPGPLWIADSTTAAIVDITGGSTVFYSNSGLTVNGGFSPTLVAQIKTGVVLGAPAGGDKGLGTINLLGSGGLGGGYYYNGWPEVLDSGITFGACGTSPTASTGSTARKGEVIAGTGATSCTINYGQAIGPNSQSCVAADDGQPYIWYPSAKGPNTVTWTCYNPAGGGNCTAGSYINWQCEGF